MFLKRRLKMFPYRMLPQICCVAILVCLLNVAESAEPVIRKDIEFANVDGHSLKLDLYLPVETKNAPRVGWSHGELTECRRTVFGLLKRESDMTMRTGRSAPATAADRMPVCIGVAQ